MNYNPNANQSDGSCIFPIYGCTNEFAINYLSIATIDNGSCIEPVYGCIYDYPFILNYNSEANVNQVGAEDFSDPCQYDFGLRSSTQVCVDPLAENYFPMADVNSNLYNPFVASNVSISNDACQFIFGCMDPLAYNYDFEAGVDDGSCVQYEDLIVGCLNEDYLEYDSLAVIQNESLCMTLVIEGCTDFNAINIDLNANVDDASCYYNFIPGCTYENAQNFNVQANLDDGSCLLTIFGCTDVNSYNFNSSATQDDELFMDVIHYQ